VNPWRWSLGCAVYLVPQRVLRIRIGLGGHQIHHQFMTRSDLRKIDANPNIDSMPLCRIVREMPPISCWPRAQGDDVRTAKEPGRP